MAPPQTRMTRQRAVIVAEELRKVKATPQRIELYSIVRERLPCISPARYNRNLDFRRIPAIRRLEKRQGRQNGSMASSWHQRMRRIHCGRIGDVMQPLPVPSVAGMQVEGFYSIVDSSVEFDGICEACAAKGLK